MILYREEPYPIQMKNIMLLDDATSGGVVYVSKATYDQALMLHNRFDGNVQRVIETLKCKSTNAFIAVMGLPQTIEKMGKTMPEPINILAPFLMFCTQNQGIEWDVNNRKMAYGILHQYSQLVDFNAMTLVPPEIRANVSLPTAILMQYQTSWDDLCSTLEDKVILAPKVVVQEVPAQPVVAPTPAPAQTPVAQPAPKQEVKPAVQEKTPEKPAEQKQELTDLEKKLLEIRKRSEARDSEINKKAKEATKPATSSTTKPATIGEKKDEAKAANAVLDEYDV